MYLEDFSLQAKLDRINSYYEIKIRVLKKLIEEEKNKHNTIESEISIRFYEDWTKMFMKEWDAKKIHEIKYCTDPDYKKKYDEEEHKRRQELYVRTHDRRKNTKCRYTKEKYKRLKCKK